MKLLKEKKDVLGLPGLQLIKWLVQRSSIFSGKAILNGLFSWIKTCRNRRAFEYMRTASAARPRRSEFLGDYSTEAFKKTFLSLAFLALLTGCATSHHPLTPSTAKATSTAPLLASYQGRFAVRYEDTEGRVQNVYGHFVWREVGTTIALQLLNPLGQILAVLEVAPSNAILKLPNRAPQTATNIEGLMQQVLGFTLPVSNLRAWLQPTSSPSLTQSNTLPKTSRYPAQFKQDGWTIEYVGTTNQQATQPLSQIQVRRINLSRDDPPTQIKFVIDP